LSSIITPKSFLKRQTNKKLPQQYPFFFRIFAEEEEKRGRKFQKLLAPVRPPCIAPVKLLFPQPH